ncbi:MAG: cytochrome c oxidase assembly protein [Magnetovibrio sp.]|nr:cytochrome c oxidase assembly protein [Magnetovibrio sp.]|tara:strand:- start:687 stop:1298 length:612 start_codon:yes stop_codon:yes gene_type:complete
MSTSDQKNVKTAVTLFAIAGGMIGLAFASVPLYQLFCQVTGYGGTTVNVATKPKKELAVDSPIITVLFDSNVDTDLPWSFSPDQNKIRVRIGEESLASYTAKNWSDNAIIGNATFNVTPHKVGQYFQKIECFCFTEQKLTPGQEISMPISFYVDPEILQDSSAMDVRNITLSYTFFRSPDDENAQINSDKMAKVPLLNKASKT